MRLKRAGGLATLIVCAALMLSPHGTLETQTIGGGGVSYSLQVNRDTDLYALTASLEHLHTELTTRLATGEDIVAIEFSSPGTTLGGQRTYLGRIQLEAPGLTTATEIRFIYVYTAQTAVPQCPPDRMKHFVFSAPRSGAPALVPSGPSFEYLMQVLQSPPAEVIDLLAQHELVGIRSTVNNNPPTGYVVEMEYSSGPTSHPVSLSVECMAGQPGIGACSNWDVTIN
ncbi:MAG: hypothetical protein AAF581_20400 [Planctomycetota bacterium]